MSKQKIKVIDGRTSLIRLTIIHEGARVTVYQPWELGRERVNVLEKFKGLIGIK